MIREFDAESSSHQTVSSATESLSLGIFRASREIARASAFFCSQAVAEKITFRWMMLYSRQKSLWANSARPFGPEAEREDDGFKIECPSGPRIPLFERSFARNSRFDSLIPAPLWTRQRRSESTISRPGHCGRTNSLPSCSNQGLERFKTNPPPATIQENGHASYGALDIDEAYFKGGRKSGMSRDGSPFHFGARFSMKAFAPSEMSGSDLT